jgi:hypothetical protein
LLISKCAENALEKDTRTVDWSIFISIVAALSAVGSVIYAAVQVRKIKTQLEQTSAYNLTNLSNQHNWELFDRHRHLPPALPAWAGLTDTGWAWRVLHLNHLNLLQLARQEHSRGLMNNRDLDSWILKARYWFRNLWAEKPAPEIREGREALRQLLRPEEGYPKEFCQWLVESKVIPPDLISD